MSAGQMRNGKPLYEHETVPVAECTPEEMERRKADGWEATGDSRSRSTGIKYRQFRRIKRKGPGK